MADDYVRGADTALCKDLLLKTLFAVPNPVQTWLIHSNSCTVYGSPELVLAQRLLSNIDGT